jgi:hypothetical protein
VYQLVVKFRSIDQGVLEAVQNDVEGEEPGIVSENGEVSKDSDGGEMDGPELFSESCLLSTAEQVAFEVDCNINIKLPWLLDLLSDSLTVTETDVMAPPAPSAIHNTEDTDLEAIFADWQQDNSFFCVSIVIYTKTSY